MNLYIHSYMKYEQDENGNLILPQSEWPTLSATDLKLRDLSDKVHQAKNIYDYSTLDEREEAHTRWSNAHKAYHAELQRVARTH